jgi:hypothetical protein
MTFLWPLMASNFVKFGHVFQKLKRVDTHTDKGHAQNTVI